MVEGVSNYVKTACNTATNDVSAVAHVFNLREQMNALS